MGSTHYIGITADMQNPGRDTCLAHQIVQMMKTTLLSKGSIMELCTAKPPPPKIVSPQLMLEGFL
jgi:hypothetical protein